MSAVAVGGKVVNRNVRYFVADRIVHALRNMHPSLANNEWARFVECLNSIISGSSIKATLCTMRKEWVRIMLHEADGIETGLYAINTTDVYTMYTPAWGDNWEHETIYSCEMQDQALSEQLVRSGIELYPESGVE